MQPLSERRHEIAHERQAAPLTHQLPHSLDDRQAWIGVDQAQVGEELFKLLAQGLLAVLPEFNGWCCLISSQRPDDLGLQDVFLIQRLAAFVQYRKKAMGAVDIKRDDDNDVQSSIR